jgi:hypothetical protein
MATLLYHWDFHEGSGTALEDIVGSNEGTLRYSNSGTIGVGPGTNGPEWVPGPNNVGYALRFTDTKDNFVATTTLISNPTNFSLSAWFKTTVACGQKILGFESTQAGVSRTYDRNIYVGTDGKLKYGHWKTTDPVGAALVSSAATVTDGKWHNAAVLLTTGGQYTLYLDCVDQGTLTVAPQSYNGYWRIGGSNFESYGGCWNFADCDGRFGAFDGDISNVRIYSGILTVDEICVLAKPPVSNALMFSCNT